MGAPEILYVSTRRRFRRGDPGFEDYLSLVALQQLSEVISIDPGLNRYAEGGSRVCFQEDLAATLGGLPPPRPHQFHQIAVELADGDGPEAIDHFTFAGCDLAECVGTSSLLHCGPWTGPLAGFVRKMNPYGLLTPEDARVARVMLPSVWTGDLHHHAHVQVWALYTSGLEGLPPGG